MRSRPPWMRSLERGSRQAVLARLGAALEQSQLHERERVAMGGARAHAEVAGQFHDPPWIASRPEAGQDRQASQQRAREARIGGVAREVPGWRVGPARAIARERRFPPAGVVV